MYRARPGSRGLGALANISQRDISNCSSGWYWLIPTCWAYSQGAWQQMGSLPTPPAPAPPAGPSTVQQETTPGAWTPDQAIEQAAETTRAQNQAFFGTVPFLSGDGSGLSTTSMIALGLAAGAILLLVISGGRRRR